MPLLTVLIDPSCIINYPLLEGASVESSNRLNLLLLFEKVMGRFAWHDWGGGLHVHRIYPTFGH